MTGNGAVIKSQRVKILLELPDLIVLGTVMKNGTGCRGR